MAHGTRSSYVAGCRCAECTQANRDYQRPRASEYRWKKRHLPEPPDGRRTIPVRLCDIPLDTRLSAAQRVNRYEDDPDEKLRVFDAALFPSDDVHWVAR